MCFEQRRNNRARFRATPRRSGTPRSRRIIPVQRLVADADLGTKARRRAFTLLEMMFVFVLIGILATLVTVNVRYYLVKGKQNGARAEVSSICTALETFYSANSRYPDNEEGLAVLTKVSEKQPEPLLKQLP